VSVIHTDLDLDLLDASQNRDCCIEG